MTRRGCLVTLCLITTTLLLAGCTAPGPDEETEAYTPPTSDGEAALVAKQALEGLEGPMSGLGEGEPEDFFAKPAIEDLRRLTATMTLPEEEDLELALSGLSGSTMDMAWEWGLDGTTSFSFDMAAGMMTITLAGYCTPEGVIIALGQEVLEGRPTAEASCDEVMEMMFDVEDEEQSDDEPDPFAEMLEDGPDAVTFHDGGAFTTVYTATDGTKITLDIDAEGRPTDALIEAPEDGRLALTMHYGPKQIIEAPAPNARLPAEIDADGAWTNSGDGDQWLVDTYTWTVAESLQTPPLDEFEAHIKTYDNGTETLVASFPFDASGVVETAGHAFHYDDADADGRVSAGDSFTLVLPEADSQWAYGIAIRDLWAEAYLDENVFAPGPAALGLVAMLGALVAAARRRTT